MTRIKIIKSNTPEELAEKISESKCFASQPFQNRTDKFKLLERYISEIDQMAEGFKNLKLEIARVQYDDTIARTIRASPFSKYCKEKLNYYWYKRTGVQ